MRKVEITIVPRQIGQLWDEILEQTLNDICRGPVAVPKQHLSALIPHTYHPSYKVHHAKVYQQRTGNLCGYHAAYNTVCFLSIMQGESTCYDILSGAAFWSFKRRIERFLFDVKKQHRLGEEWPWRQNDILHGDFERTYNRLCLQHAPDFAIFRDHDHFQFLSFTWEFQYQNLLLSEEKRRELNGLIAHFREYKEEQPLVVGFMLAITNHWMLMIAVKSKQNVQYWFFDSSNRDFLQLNEQQIEQLVQRLDRERKELGRQGFSEFFKKNMAICMRDTQISLKLIVDCLEGKTTIQEYAYNQQFELFAGELEKYWDVDEEGTEHVIKEYWYNIAAFFRVPLKHELLNRQNQKRLAKLVHISHELRNKSEHGNRLNALVKKYSQQTRM